MAWENFQSEVRGAETRRGPRCRIAVLLDTLSETDRAEVQAALGDRSVGHPVIVAALRKRLGDDAPSLWSVGNHRRGNCGCT